MQVIEEGLVGSNLQRQTINAGQSKHIASLNTVGCGSEQYNYKGPSELVK